MCEIHVAWPTDKITLQVESDKEPLVVEKFGQSVKDSGENDENLRN